MVVGTIIAVVLVLAALGFLHLTRGTVVRHVQGMGESYVPVGVGEPDFPSTVTMLTSAQMGPGNRVEVTLNGDGTYHRMWDDLRSAEQSITLQIYYGQPGRMASMLTSILRERAKAGVRVFVLYDAFGTGDIPAVEREALLEAGVHVKPFRPFRLSTLHLAQHRSHVRGITIDGRIGWTGGFGIDDKWFGDGRTGGSWRETNVRFEGPAVAQLQAAFIAAWVEATGVLAIARAAAPPLENGVASAGMLYASPTLGSTVAERLFALSIAAARRSLYLTNAYFAPDQNFIGLLVEAAGRGVDVRVLTAGPRTDVPVVRLAGRASYEVLLDAGIRIYEWRPTTLHAKTYVVAGEWATVGSMNFDNRSLTLNDEATLLILDPALGRQIEKIFFDDLRDAEEVTASRFRRRSRIQRVWERAAHVLTPLL